MKRKHRPTPTAERLRELFHYDPETGVFTRAMGVKKGAAGTVAGTPSQGYVNIGVDWRIYRAHRLAWCYVTGSDPGAAEIDHINGDTSDNRFSNLRLADAAENSRNKRAAKSSTTKLKGVYFDKERSRYCAEVIHEGKKHRLGRFHTQAEAKAAYDAAAKVLHGEFFRS